MTACDLIIDHVLTWGVEVVFGLPGDGINGFMEALREAREKIRYVHVRHEEAAAMAATGYAKFIGKLGVCFATSGPGAAHLLNGLYDAKIDHAPVLALTGMTHHDLIRTHYLQDMNQDYLYQDVEIFKQRLVAFVAGNRSHTRSDARHCTCQRCCAWLSRTSSRDRGHQ
jgi:pyruvate dehydrogenase (quinone)/pyruvate oxidase